MRKQLLLLCLCVCFALTGLGAAYHVCAAPSEQKMAGMDCEMPGKCCIDMSCPKCFSSPVAFFSLDKVGLRMTFAALPQAVEHTLRPRNPAMFERPPKIG